MPGMGQFVPSGSYLFHVIGARKPIRQGLLRSAVALGDERTMEQDPEFALRLLVDIANKALSPAVNDPTTAVQALDQIDDLLRRLGCRDLDVGDVRDHDGRLCVSYPAPAWQDFLELGVGEIIRYGEGSLQVSRRLRALLDGLTAVVPDYRKEAVEKQVGLLNKSVERAFADPFERQVAATADRAGVGSHGSRPTQ